MNTTDNSKFTHKLFIAADTALVFSSRAKAFIHVDNKELKSWMLLTTGYKNGRASVYNPLVRSKLDLIEGTNDGCVEYFNSESDALKYIGSFL